MQLEHRVLGVLCHTRKTGCRPILPFCSVQLGQLWWALGHRVVLVVFPQPTGGLNPRKRAPEMKVMFMKTDLVISSLAGESGEFCR